MKIRRIWTSFLSGWVLLANCSCQKDLSRQNHVDSRTREGGTSNPQEANVSTKAYGYAEDARTAFVQIDIARRCGGVVISENVVLTSAQCAMMRHRPVELNKYAYRDGYFSYSAKDTIYAFDVYIQPHSGSDDCRFGLAAVVFDQPLNRPIARLPAQALDVPEKVWHVFFPEFELNEESGFEEAPLKQVDFRRSPVKREAASLLINGDRASSRCPVIHDSSDLPSIGTGEILTEGSSVYGIGQTGPWLEGGSQDARRVSFIDLTSIESRSFIAALYAHGVRLPDGDSEASDAAMGDFPGPPGPPIPLVLLDETKYEHFDLDKNGTDDLLKIKIDRPKFEKLISNSNRHKYAEYDDRGLDGRKLCEFAGGRWVASQAGCVCGSGMHFNLDHLGDDFFILSCTKRIAEVSRMRNACNVEGAIYDASTLDRSAHKCICGSREYSIAEIFEESVDAFQKRCKKSL